MAIQINNNWRDRAYNNACNHGFHNEEKSDEYWFMLIITEISEAIDADRKDKHAFIEEFNKVIKLTDYSSKKTFERCIKGSIEDELADIVIRCLDFAGMQKINVEQRIILSYIVSKKKSFVENMYAIVRDITNYKYTNEELINYAFRQVLRVAEFYNIDILWHIEQKMKYNEMRPMLNGKKY